MVLGVIRLGAARRERSGADRIDLSRDATQAAVSSVNIGLKLNPSSAKNASLRPTSATGRFTNSVRPVCQTYAIEPPTGDPP